MGKVSGGDSGNLELLAKIKELEEKNAELETELKGKISVLKVKAFNLGSHTIPANGATNIPITLEADEGYAIISRFFLTASCNNSNVIFIRYRTSSEGDSLIFRNLTNSDISNTINAYFLEFKR